MCVFSPELFLKSVHSPRFAAECDECLQPLRHDGVEDLKEASLWYGAVLEEEIQPVQHGQRSAVTLHWLMGPVPGGGGGGRG